MAEPVSLEDLRRAARRRLPKQVFDFVDGGAEDEVTLTANRSAFRRISFRPRHLVDVSRRDISTTVLGQRVALPVLLAPAGLAKLVHREGELAAARAAGDEGTVFALSTASSYSIEEVAAVATGPLWFQLYLWRDRDIVRSLVERAGRVGYQALMVTLDVPVVGRRDRDLRNGMSLPPRFTAASILDAARRPRWVADFLSGPRITFRNFIDSELGAGDSGIALMAYVNRELTNPAATWEEMKWLRDAWRGKLLVKGVLTAEDAELALANSVDGLVVSNHGGRQLDGAPATMQVLPQIMEAVGDRAEVLVDGGFRRGSDVVKAIALGARAAMVGRPWFFGLAAGGAHGVRQTLRLLGGEIDQTLALLGRPTIGDLDRSAISC